MQDHWIVIYAREGDDYLIQDTWRYPAETKRVTLTSRYGFAGTPAEIIKDILIYSGTPSAGSSVSLPAQPVERKARTLPENPLVVYVSADSLALRRQPAILDGNIIRRLPLNTKLLVLEPAQEASARVGQMNVWLEVQVEGRSEQGFVAAWYISTSAQPPPPEAPAGTPTANSGTASPLHILYVTADGLLLRRQPVIASNNVLRRLPANTQLIALDAPAQVNAKVGVNDQWLKVREVSGFEGYVAAQFVSHKRQEQPLGVSPARPGQPAPPAPDADRLVLRTTEDRVTLRSQPVITSATLLKRLAFQAELLVIEPIAEAAGKVGRANQWIRVRDISGAEGYVAAWYLVKSPVPASS
jgi:SH3-like domain-containing protein